MNHRIRPFHQVVLLGMLLLIGVALPGASAQTAGARLEGIVKDASQAVIPGVAVTATNEGTNISYTSLTNDAGLYVFVTMQPGAYTLTCELTGFKRYVSRGLVLKVGDTLSIPITLETGDISTEIVVSAAAPLIDVTSNKIGAVVQERQILDLPLNGRNPMMLYYLQAGTNPRDSLGGQQAVGSVDGLRTNANNVKVEGVWASDGSFDMSPAAPAVPVPQESVGEYRVTTSSATADSGRGSGAMVQVVYKSGTNSFHGSAYLFNRNTVYNANNFFTNRAGAPRPVFLRNQYGASFGGPIIRDKTFFFANWEGQKQRQAAIENKMVFTDPVRKGAFRYNTTGKANSGSMVDKDGNPTVPFGTINLFTVDPSRLGFDSSGIVAAKLNQIPLPNNYDIGDGFNLGGYRYTSSNPNDGNQVIAKLDHTLSLKHQLTTSFGWASFESGSSFLFSGFRQSTNVTRRRFLTIGLVSSLTPTLTNEMRLGGTRWWTDSANPNPAALDPKGNFQLSSLGSGRGGGSNGNPLAVFLPQDTPTTSFNWSDSISWVLKNHTFKLGFEVTHSYSNYRFGGDEYIPTVYPSNSFNPANVPA
ncbi:MAG: carboxypeptidase regulatory-like domain-containing protein, partial [Acidobacteria bacterium]|nr:carboxypeptidase regulatory-like domain-containing protein [Acidobacteriota bacterium]